MSLATALFSFDGRTRRRTYWLAGLALVVVQIGLMVTLAPNQFTDASAKTPLSLLLVSLLLLVPAAAITVRRLNDMDWSPTWAYAVVAISALFSLVDYVRPFGPIETWNRGNQVVWFVVMIALIICIAIGFKGGSRGANPHGPDPRGQTA
jgi:uncharacterized membrane protein YhaH (DUF805 family)